MYIPMAIQWLFREPECLFKNPNDFYNNSDWTFTDDTDMLDIWWTFIVAKDKFSDQYDIGKLSQTRERRRMIGDFTISALDIYNGRTYPDVISIHVSSFDTLVSLKIRSFT